jgi:hypothetical protein
MPRGGRRQGTPGKGYSNRTDLSAAPNMAQNTAATGGMVASAPAQPQQQQALPMQPQPPLIGADEVPNLSDPSQRPGEPVTAGLNIGAGPGPESLGAMPPSPTDPVRQAVQSLLLISPNPDLVRILARLDQEGR